MSSREFSLLGPDIKQHIARHQSEVPVKLHALASDIGVKVIAATLPAGISGELRPSINGFVIKVNRHDSPSRQRFTVAHELAHYLLHRDHIGSGITDDALYRSGLSDSREAEANRLAADLLMPKAPLRAAYHQAVSAECSDLLSKLAEDFKVSEAAMKIRLEQL